MHYDDIRPYYDEEYLSVIQRLLEKEAFIGAIKNYFPADAEADVKNVLLSCKGIEDFQQRIIASVIESIIETSLTDLSFSGLEGLTPQQTYLFMSNHRDIVLDSAFLNYGLNKYGFNTSEIAIGSNLLGIDWVRDLVRINKSFIVKRNLSNQEMLEASRTLSAYIQYTIHEKRESIWIAQREGRSKDGDDRTNPGLLKMLGLGSDQPLLQYLIDLNILPVSISYEYDPCDSLKLPELIARSKGESYSKPEGEDVRHMLLGIQGFKGRVHLAFGHPIQEALAELADIRNRNEQLRRIAGIIDQQIHGNYRLWPNNYIAADLLQATDQWKEHYSGDEKKRFLTYAEERYRPYAETEMARTIFLKMYANPVFNRYGKAEQ